MRSLRVSALMPLLLLSSNLLSAQKCDPLSWVDSVSISDNTSPSGQEYEVQIDPKQDAAGNTYFDTAENKEQFANGAGVIVRLVSESNETVDLTPAFKFGGNADLLQFRLPLDQLTSFAANVNEMSVVIPGGRLRCGGEVVQEETKIEVKDAFKAGNPVKIPELLSFAPEPWITNLDFGTPGADEDGKGTLALDFDFGRSFSLGDSRVVKGFWHEWRGTLDVSGSFSTEKEEYFDGIQGKAGFGFRSTDLEGRRTLLRSWILKGEAGPEATSDTDNVDYLYAARAQAIVGIKLRTGNQRFFQPFPLIGLAVERVDPSKREDGSVPENYTRAVADFFWHLYLTDTTVLEIDGEVRRRLDGEDDADRWSRRWDFTLSVMKDNTWQPFIKYTRGEEAPLFEFHEEILAGIKLGNLLGLRSGG